MTMLFAAVHEVERYPDYAPAHSMLAFAMLMSRVFGWTLVAPQVKDAAAVASSG
jgi:hypothetical protein